MLTTRPVSANNPALGTPRVFPDHSNPNGSSYSLSASLPMSFRPTNPDLPQGINIFSDPQTNKIILENIMFAVGEDNLLESIPIHLPANALSLQQDKNFPNRLYSFADINDLRIKGYCRRNGEGLYFSQRAISPDDVEIGSLSVDSQPFPWQGLKIVMGLSFIFHPNTNLEHEKVRFEPPYAFQQPIDEAFNALSRIWILPDYERGVTFYKRGVSSKDLFRIEQSPRQGKTLYKFNINGNNVCVFCLVEKDFPPVAYYTPDVAQLVVSGAVALVYAHDVLETFHNGLCKREVDKALGVLFKDQTVDTDILLYYNRFRPGTTVNTFGHKFMGNVYADGYGQFTITPRRFETPWIFSGVKFSQIEPPMVCDLDNTTPPITFQGSAQFRDDRPGHQERLLIVQYLVPNVERWITEALDVDIESPEIEPNKKCDLF